MQTLFNFRSLVNELLEQYNQKQHNQNAVDSQLKYTTQFYCHPARDLFSFSVIDIQKIAEMIVISWQRPFYFLSSPSIWPKKGLNFWRRPFFFGPLEWWQPAGTLLGLNVAY